MITLLGDPGLKFHAIKPHESVCCSNPDKSIGGLGNCVRRSVKDSVPYSPGSMAILGEERVRVHGPGSRCQAEQQKANMPQAKEHVTRHCGLSAGSRAEWK